MTRFQLYRNRQISKWPQSGKIGSKHLTSQFFIPKVVIKNTHIVADDTSLGALQPSKASPHRPRHWSISMGILIVQASVIDDNIDTKIQMLQLENTQDKHSGKYW